MVHDLDLYILNFLSLKRIIVELERKAIFALMYYENDLFYPVDVSDKYLRIVWIYYWSNMKINHIMSISNILTDLCARRQEKEQKLIKISCIMSISKIVADIYAIRQKNYNQKHF